MPPSQPDITALSQTLSDAVTKRPPQQARSRRSQIKALTAARQLLEDEGYDSLTLQKVSRQSGVSIGSIYGRFTGKDELMRAVQEVLIEELEAPCWTLNDGPQQHIQRRQQIYVQLVEALPHPPAVQSAPGATGRPFFA